MLLESANRQSRPPKDMHHFLRDGAKYEEMTGEPSTSIIVRGITLRDGPLANDGWTASEF